MSDLVPFETFLAETAAARPEQYNEALAAGARQAGVEPETARAEFERMKDHILAYYQGVRPVRSFAGPGGETVDCIPFEQQPAARAEVAAGRRLAQTAPP